MAGLHSRDGGELRFRWLESERIPDELDLRRCGWTLEETRAPLGDCVGVLHAGRLDSLGWMRVLATIHVEMRRFVIVIGVKNAHERATLLHIGFGDALSDAIDIEELRARATRIADFTRWLPRLRQLGALRLDLLAREAFGHGKPLNLNPREFTLLWRLADTPNQTVSKQALINDVWRMGFVPETNSIAVHMSRLRRKLAFVGLERVIETASSGGYLLATPDRQYVEAIRMAAQGRSAPPSAEPCRPETTPLSAAAH